MDEQADDRPETSTVATRTDRLGDWLAASAALTVFVALVAGYAPARLRLLGLFSVATGAAIGYGVGRLARGRGVDSARLASTAALGLSTLALLGSTFLAQRSHRTSLPAESRSSAELPATELLEAKLLASPPDEADVAARRNWESMRDDVLRVRAERDAARARRAGFAGYLRHRTAGLGEWRDPWPLVFWLAETALGMGVGAVLAAWTVRASGSPPLNRDASDG